MTARQIIIALSIKHQGNWDEILADIQSRKTDELEQYYDETQQCITILDSEYPETLKQAFKPPFVLFYSGDISLLNTAPVAVLGSRNPSATNISQTIKIVENLNKNHKTVLTTNAVGINETVLKSSEKTILVLDCGLNLTDKKANLIITEYPKNTEKTQYSCTIRSRLVSAIADKIAFTYMRAKSGLLITANYALSYSRDIYCVPDLENDDSTCNTLLQEGAYLLISGTELL